MFLCKKMYQVFLFPAISRTNAYHTQAPPCLHVFQVPGVHGLHEICLNWTDDSCIPQSDMQIYNACDTRESPYRVEICAGRSVGAMAARGYPWTNRAKITLSSQNSMERVLVEYNKSHVLCQRDNIIPFAASRRITTRTNQLEFVVVFRWSDWQGHVFRATRYHW